MKKTALFLSTLLCFLLPTGCGNTPTGSEPPANAVTETGSSTNTTTGNTTVGDNFVDLFGEPSGTTDTSTTTQPSSTTSKTTGETSGISSVTTTTAISSGNTTTAGAATPSSTATARPVALPIPGYDPDGKGRIQLGEVSLADSTVTMVVKNVSTTWMTEETSFFDYTCYDAAGEILVEETLFIGTINAGKQRTYQFTIPAGTMKVELTGFTTTYWTEWKK